MRYLVSGYYGEGNAGDEAILAGMIEAICRQDGAASFTVLSFDPEDTRRRHRVDAVSTTLRDPAVLLGALRRSDVLLSGGGSFLHEADFALYGRSFLFRQGKLRPIPYFLTVVFLARAVGRPVMWYAQGLGPLHTPAARYLVALAGSSSRVVAWRDRDSAALAAQLGMAGARRIGMCGPVHLVVPDPAYALRPPAPEAAVALLLARSRSGESRAGAHDGAGPDADDGAGPGVHDEATRRYLQPGRFVAVSLRPWLDRAAYQEHALQALARTVEEHDLGLVFVPFQERTDGPLCRELASRPEVARRAWVVEGVEDPAELAGILGLSACAVTMRLHAGILSAVGGVPAVPIEYDPKVGAFARQTGQQDALVTVEELEAPRGEERLRAALATVLGRREARARIVAGRAEELRRETASAARLAVALAGYEGA